MPTNRGWVCAGAGLTFTALGRIFGIFELTAFGITLAVLVVCALLSVWLRCPLRLDLGRTERTTAVTAGDTARIELRIRNRGGRRTATVVVRDHVENSGQRVTVWLAPLGPGQSRVGAFRLPTTVRGLLPLGPLVAVRTDPFGLAERVIARGPGGEVIAHPTIMPTLSAALLDAASGRARGNPTGDVDRASRRGNGDFRSLRPYVAGDDLRRVHWPSSARAGDLLIREEDEARSATTAIVLLDTAAASYGSDPASGPCFELAVSCAASLVAGLAHDFDRVRLEMPAEARTATGAISTRRADDLRDALDALAVVVRSGSATTRGDDLGSRRDDFDAPEPGRGTAIIAVLGPIGTPAWARHATFALRCVGDDVGSPVPGRASSAVAAPFEAEYVVHDLADLSWLGRA